MTLAAIGFEGCEEQVPKHRRPGFALMSDLTVRPQDLGIGRLFEEVSDAVIVADATTGRIVLWNQVATCIFGYSPAEALELRV